MFPWSLYNERKGDSIAGKGITRGASKNHVDGV
jgi:hypothetical protein